MTQTSNTKTTHRTGPDAQAQGLHPLFRIGGLGPRNASSVGRPMSQSGHQTRK